MGVRAALRFPSRWLVEIGVGRDAGIAPGSLQGTPPAAQPNSLPGPSAGGPGLAAADGSTFRCRATTREALVERAEPRRSFRDGSAVERAIKLSTLWTTTV
jgi:hypothetical protein